MARAAPPLQATLGEPIQEGWLTFGEVRHAYGADFAAWTTSLRGPKGSGQLMGAAERLGSAWHYSRLTFVPDDSEQIVDVTPPPARDPFFAGPSKKQVLLVPLGPLSKDDLAWAPEYYKAKFGFNAQVLAPIPLNASAWNPRRGQLVAETSSLQCDRSFRNGPETNQMSSSG